MLMYCIIIELNRENVLETCIPTLWQKAYIDIQLANEVWQLHKAYKS